jgi:haloalkane dehalogenase
VEGFERFDRPLRALFGDSDPVTRGADRLLQVRIPGAREQPHRTIGRAGHFSQEDAGEKLAALPIAYMNLSPESLPTSLDSPNRGA